MSGAIDKRKQYPIRTIASITRRSSTTTTTRWSSTRMWCPTPTTTTAPSPASLRSHSSWGMGLTGIVSP